MDLEAYGRYLLENDFDVVGMGSTTLQINQVIKTFEYVKKIKPGIVTVLGGVHPAIMPSEALEATAAVDYLVLGEGEVPFSRLVDWLKDGREGREPDGIAGLAFRSAGKALVVNPPVPANTLAEADFPTPPYELFPMKRYIAQISYTKRFPSYSVVASRGCPFKCSFCNGSAVLGKRVRYKSADRLIEEILLLKNEYGPKG